MKIAIYGLSGAGKSHMARALLQSEEYKHFKYINVDVEVSHLYNTEEALRNFVEANGGKTLYLNYDRAIDKAKWGTYLFRNPDVLTKLEDMLFYEYFLPMLHTTDDQIIDGMIPRFVFLYPFDRIMFVDAPEQVRRKNLRTRGVAPERIDEIIRYQKTIYLDSRP